MAEVDACGRVAIEVPILTAQRKVFWQRLYVDPEDVVEVAAPVPTGQGLVGHRVKFNKVTMWRKVVTVAEHLGVEYLIVDNGNEEWPDLEAVASEYVVEVEGFGDTPPAQPTFSEPITALSLSRKVMEQAARIAELEARPAAEPVGWAIQNAAGHFGSIVKERYRAERWTDRDEVLTLCAVVPVDGPEPEPPEPFAWIVRAANGGVVGWWPNERSARGQARPIRGTVHRVLAPVPEP